MPDFRLPDLGEGLTEAEIVRWLVAVGDSVLVDQPVVEVETAKATVEVPCPFAGTVTATHGQAGDSVAVGAPLVTVAVPSDTAVASDRAVPNGSAGPRPSPAAGSGQVLVGYGTTESAPRRRRASARSGPAPTVPRVAVISPLVRRLAHDHGVDVGQIAGTGPRGIVLRHDVELAIARGPAAAEPPPAPETPSLDRAIPLRGIRRAAADKLTQSRREIPEATVWVDVDATELLAARDLLNADGNAAPISIVALLGRFAIAGLTRYPELNARVEPDQIILLRRVNLGFAAQTDRGLVVPVVRDANRLSTRALSEAMTRLTATARAGGLTPGDVTNGTFTVNNYGVFGVDGSAAIINYPEVAILGIGRIIERPWVVGGQLTIRRVGQLTLAFDHRACDGAAAGGFLRYVADCVESPVRALGDL
jgi:2-oxoisovalerate dehydrogenase E2 component (dihydrolipoyl transacylase)